MYSETYSVKLWVRFLEVPLTSAFWEIADMQFVQCTPWCGDSQENGNTFLCGACGIDAWPCYSLHAVHYIVIIQPCSMKARWNIASRVSLLSMVNAGLTLFTDLSDLGTGAFLAIIGVRRFAIRRVIDDGKITLAD